MYIILVLIALYVLYLAADAYRTHAARRRIRHIVHVNGIRGKSSVTRLIHAGLAAGGMRSFCKVTGTDPMILCPDGTEKVLRRLGVANIREQARVLRMAAKQNADVLVIECMAITPELQRASQRNILKADIGVLTNVRRDHTDVMGETLEEICDSLLNTLPEKGMFFTAEEKFFSRIAAAADKTDTKAVLALHENGGYDFDFPENVALALAVCEYLGVSRKKALSGMKNYSRDPYALSVHRAGDAVFVNGLSINDPASTVAVWNMVREKYALNEKKFVLLINNRADRGSRTKDMLQVCRALAPDEILLFGAGKAYMKARIAKLFPGKTVRCMKKAEEMDINNEFGGCTVFAVGNLKGAGREILKKVRGAENV